MPATILMFIPGNPGIVDYYGPFFTALKEHHKQLQIYAYNHVGFTSNPTKSLKLPPHQINLDAQIAHAIDRFDALLLAHKGSAGSQQPQIYLAGHSVGAYIACKVLEARPDVVQRIYLLTPTLTEIALSPQGRLLTPCSHIPGFLQLVAGFVWLWTSLLPQQYRLKFIAWWTGFSKEAVRVTTDSVVQPGNVYTGLVLGASEMTDIRSPDAKFWRKYGKRCSAYWVMRDHWIHEASRDQLLADTRIESYFCKRANHAFCVRHSEIVADVVAGWLGRDLAMKFADELH
ncbi:hypothetical protein BCR37DRAFT_218035 [Protomyces lactucae-debilis]|uniref:Alpha/Beta hydrolase protein n=1 Tax=Protomyces lactucae-debilis TaxID=2754530 RepID=A0A1Y2FQQ3_PROLT|nr:uncharacterized protein BCR37DRAFT_218035 [Protomyces lactucae-debilis]ORY86332.1 hypothetical protein BCR37DRAFT_218035 [Protomyces lactucae-debilis]